MAAVHVRIQKLVEEQQVVLRMSVGRTAEEHVCHELRVLSVASGNTLVTCLHTSLREIDRYPAV